MLPSSADGGQGGSKNPRQGEDLANVKHEPPPAGPEQQRGDQQEQGPAAATTSTSARSSGTGQQEKESAASAGRAGPVTSPGSGPSHTSAAAAVPSFAAFGAGSGSGGRATGAAATSGTSLATVVGTKRPAPPDSPTGLGLQAGSVGSGSVSSQSGPHLPRSASISRPAFAQPPVTVGSTGSPFPSTSSPSSALNPPKRRATSQSQQASSGARRVASLSIGSAATATAAFGIGTGPGALSTAGGMSHIGSGGAGGSGPGLGLGQGLGLGPGPVPVPGPGHGTSLPAAPIQLSEEQLVGKTTDQLIAIILRVQAQHQEYVAHISAQYDSISQQLAEVRGSLAQFYSAQAASYQTAAAQITRSPGPTFRTPQVPASAITSPVGAVARPSSGTTPAAGVRQPTRPAPLAATPQSPQTADAAHMLPPTPGPGTSQGPQAPGPPLYDYRTVGTVAEVWREYREGNDGQPAIEQLDAQWGSRWRPEPRGRTWYSRRKVIWDKIKEYMSEGLPEQDAVQEVERLRDGGTINKLIRLLQIERKDQGGNDDVSSIA